MGGREAGGHLADERSKHVLTNEMYDAHLERRQGGPEVGSVGLGHTQYLLPFHVEAGGICVAEVREGGRERR